MAAGRAEVLANVLEANAAPAPRANLEGFHVGDQRVAIG